MNRTDFYSAIKKRAGDKGIRIEGNGKYIKKKRIWQIKFEGSNKIYYYNDTLQNIALKLGLVTDNEYMQINSLGYCPKCGRMQDKKILENYGYCLNC